MRQQVANPDDILVVGEMAESAFWPEFDKGQVITASELPRAIRGRRYRNAVVTAQASWRMDVAAYAELDFARYKGLGGQIISAEFWRPEVKPNAWDRFTQRFTDLIGRFF